MQYMYYPSFACLSLRTRSYIGRVQHKGATTGKSQNLFPFLNPTALRKAKIVYNFGLSKCNSVKMAENVDVHSCTSNRSKIILSKFSYSRLNLFVTDVEKQSSVTDFMTHT